MKSHPHAARRSRWIATACGLALLSGIIGSFGPAAAQGDVHRQVTVAVLQDAAPFSYQAPDETWQGLAVEMWNLIADELHLDTRFVGMDRGQIAPAIAAGRVQFGVGPLAITEQRLQQVDFSVPIAVTGIAIAVPYVPRGVLHMVEDAVLSLTFLKLAAGLFALLMFVGTIFWITERRRNPDFAGRRIHGWGSGIWLSIVTMTTVGYGDKAPRTFGGRVVAALWMFISIALISIFTGTVATLLTTERLGPGVEGFEDLTRVRVACISVSAGFQLLQERRIHCQQFRTLEEALQALIDKKADALVHDRALLAWALKEHPDLPVKVLPGTLRPEYYAFAMAPNEALRRPMDEAIARTLDSARWEQFRFAYLGNQADHH